MKDLAGNILDDDSSMCKTLNTYFASVITKEKTDNIPEVKQVFHGGSSRLLSLIDITPDNVLHQHVDTSTRVNNILDLVITNEISM